MRRRFERINRSDHCSNCTKAEAIEPYFSQDTAEDAEATHGFTAVAVNSFGTWLGSSHIMIFGDIDATKSYNRVEKKIGHHHDPRMLNMLQA